MQECLLSYKKASVAYSVSSHDGKFKLEWYEEELISISNT